MNYQLTLTHLYPQNLNLYGDTGNVICLKKRCEWHEIQLTINNLSLVDKSLKDKHLTDKLDTGKTDIYFIGGGQDSDQIKVVDDFHKLKSEAVKADIENNVVFLGVCGGYQLMGHTFLMGDGNSTEGLGIIDIETKAPGTTLKQRCIGNLIAELNDSDYEKIRGIYKTQTDNIPKTILGFENHSGQTFLKHSPLNSRGDKEGLRPLAKTLKGFGNNATEGLEGARYKNVFGTYMHGSFLPKNPHIADYLIWLALVRKYNDQNIKFEKLPDSEEFEAHSKVIELYGK